MRLEWAAPSSALNYDAGVWKEPRLLQDPMNLVNAQRPSFRRKPGGSIRNIISRESRAAIEVSPVAAKLLTPSHLCAAVQPDLSMRDIVEEVCGSRLPVSVADLEQAVQYHRCRLQHTVCYFAI